MARSRTQTRSILALMEQGMTNDEIAKALGIHSITVARSGIRRDMETVRGMLDMVDAGFTLQEVGEKFGVTKQRVAQIVGVEDERGSRGKKVSIDASQETWDGLMEALDDAGVIVNARPGVVDARAVSEFFDLIASGRMTLKLRRLGAGKAA